MREVLSRAISLVVIIILGHVIKRLGWMGKEDFPKLSRIMLTITLPAALMTSFDSFSLDFILLYIALIGFVFNMLNSIVGRWLRHKESTEEQVYGILHSGSYNIGAFAMPYLSAFLGGTSLIYSSLFDIGNAFSSAGVNYSWALSKAKNRAFSVRAFVAQMFRSPVFVTYLFLLLLQILGWRLPAPVIEFTSIVGSANTFIAMLMLGIGLELRLHSTKIGRALRLLTQRYVMATIFLLLTWFLLPAPAEVRSVLGVLYFSPIAAMISGFVAEADGDVELSTFTSSVSIIVGIIVMPIIIILLQR